MNNDIPSDIIAKFQSKYNCIKQYSCVGEPIEPGIYRTLDGGWQCNYHDWCAIVIRPGETEPHEIHGAIGQRWYREWGAFDISGKRGSLGHPISDEEVYEGDGDPNDRISHFENGDIIWTAKTDETRIVNIKDRARWYKAKHDQLLDLLRRAVEAPAPERHNEALKAVEEKCKEDQFDVVLLGVFQYGKSTTLDTLCGGREISPQGKGAAPTSAVPVSVQSLGENESAEWGELRFKTKRQLAGELFDTFESDICDSDSTHPLVAYLVKEDALQSGTDGESKSMRDRFCDGFDFDNPDHLSSARSALESAWAFWKDNKYHFSGRKLQLMEVETQIVRFYGTDEYRTMLSVSRCSVDDARNFVRFPADWSKNKAEGFSYNVKFERVRFAYVDAVVLHLRSSFLAELGCRVTDCPGLDASAYDRKVTRDALRRADGVLFIHRSDRTIGASTTEELLELVGDTGRKNKTVFAANLWGISRSRALCPYVDEDGSTSPSIFEDIEKNIRNGGYDFPVVWCHALLANLASLGERRLRTNEPFSQKERQFLADKADIRDDNDRIFDDGRSDEKLWLAAVDEINHRFKAPEIKNLSALDETSVAAVRQASNFDELLQKASAVALREKTGSILIDNGSKKALETLKSHEAELQLREENAKQSELQCAEEVAAAKHDLDEYEAEAEEAILRSNFVKSKDDAFKLLSRDLVYNVLSEQFYTGLSRKIARTVRKLNAKMKSLSETSFREAVRAEVGPLITEFFADKTIGVLGEWSEHPTGRWGTFVKDVYTLDDEIQELGAKHFQGKRIFKKIPIPALPNTLAIEQMPEQISRSINGIDNITESLREGFWTKLWNIFKWIVDVLLKLLGRGKSEEQILSEYAAALCPELEKSFRDERVFCILEAGVRPVFENIHGQILCALSNSRSAYRKKIQARCDELIEDHRSSDEELHRIAEANRKLREECIAPLRSEVEAFEKSVETAQS